MKLNQFARLTPDIDQQLKELARIGLPADPQAPFADTAAAMYAAFSLRHINPRRNRISLLRLRLMHTRILLSGWRQSPLK